VNLTRIFVNVDVQFFQKLPFESCLFFATSALVLDTAATKSTNVLQERNMFIHDLKFGEIGQLQQQDHTSNMAAKVETTDLKLGLA